MIRGAARGTDRVRDYLDIPCEVNTYLDPFSPFYRSFRGSNRLKSMTGIALPVLWILFGVLLVTETIYELIKVNMTLKVLFLPLLLFGLYLLLINMAYLTKHGLSGFINRMIDSGFKKNNEFPDDTGLPPSFMNFTNGYQDQSSVAQWYDKRLLLPFWLYFNAFHPAGQLVSFLYIIGLDLYARQRANGFCNTYPTITNRNIVELQLLMEEFRMVEERAINIYNIQYNDEKSLQTDRSILYRNKDFLRIFQECFGKSPRQHKAHLELMSHAKEVVVVLSFFLVYTCSPMLAFCVHYGTEANQESFVGLLLMSMTATLFFLLSGFCIIDKMLTKKCKDMEDKLYSTQRVQTEEVLKRLLRILLITLESVMERNGLLVHNAARTGSLSN